MPNAKSYACTSFSQWSLSHPSKLVAVDEERNMNRTFTIKQTGKSTHSAQVLRLTSMEGAVQRFTVFLGLLALVILTVALVSCAAANNEDANKVTGRSITQTSGQTCLLSEVRYPTTAEDFTDANLLYGGRGFLHEYNGIKHLGRDLILPAGKVIHPIACGKLVVYRPAKGYGSLVAVLEHELPYPIEAVNGDGEYVQVKKFLSIYGHGSSSDPTNADADLTWQTGQNLQVSDALMYIQADKDEAGQDVNGDGPEHLHFGIRLQSMSEAVGVDPTAWFRGNDSADGKYKKYFADPEMFMQNLFELFGDATSPPANILSVTNHPIGTLLFEPGTGKDWLVVESDQILDVSSYQILPRSCRVVINTAELACYKKAAFHPLTMVLDAEVIKFDGLPEVYRLFPGPGYETTGYHVFLSYESFLSWGYKDADIKHFPASEKQELMSALKHQGGVGMMPGTLAKAIGQSEVAVADQHGTRRPIFHWDVFQQAGYSQSCVFEIDGSTLDVVAGSRSNDMLTSASLLECPAQAGSTICTPGSVLPCACGTLSGTQSCLDNGMQFGPCMCEPGPGGNTPECNQGEYRDCSSECPANYSGLDACDQGFWSGYCVCTPSNGTGGSAGSSGTGGAGGASGSGGSSGSGGTSNVGGSSGAGGSGGTSNVGGSSGTGGIAGSGGSGGSSTDLVSVTLVYQGPSWTNPVIEASWGTRPYGAVPGCASSAPGYASCTFDVPQVVLDGMYWQVKLGNSRYWGDTSGVSPAPCVPAGELPNYYGTEVTVIGTVSLKLDGVPEIFGLCSNGIMNPAYSNICGESPYPYMNGCFL